MLRNALLILTIAGLHALPLPSRDDSFGPAQVQSVVPVEFRRQGTQPSRRHLVDLRTGLEQNPVSEMDRRVSHRYYAPFSTDEFRQGTQGSRRTLVDLYTGLRIEPLGEMQRGVGNVYAPPSHDEFRQGTQYSRAVLVDPRTGLMIEPVGEMSRNGVRTGSSTEQDCQGTVFNGQCYHFFPDAKTFGDAESSCRQLAPGGHLASVSSSDLHSRLASMVTEASNGPVLTWLGGVKQADKLKWIDGSSWGYSDLMPAEAEAGSRTVKCLEMFRLDEKWWSPADCDLQRPFICSRPLIA